MPGNRRWWIPLSLVVVALLLTGCRISIGLSWTWTEPPDPRIDEVTIIHEDGTVSRLADNGELRPGETAELAVTLRNRGAEARSVRARLLAVPPAPDAYRVEVLTTQWLDYGTLRRRGTATETYEVAVDPGAAAGEQVRLMVEISDRQDRRWFRELHLTIAKGP